MVHFRGRDFANACVQIIVFLTSFFFGFTIQLVVLAAVCLPEEMHLGEINGRLNIASERKNKSKGFFVLFNH